MQIFVSTLNGKTLTIDVEPSEPISSIKSKIESMEEIPVNEQRLSYGGKQLVDDKLVSDYEIQNKSMIQLLLTLKGGKKKKKKVYSTPKKVKTTRKRRKISTLNHFALINDGTVKITKESCPTCGFGTFMTKCEGYDYCCVCRGKVNAKGVIA